MFIDFRYKGGWWHWSCHHSNLNGFPYSEPASKYGTGINWRSWKGYNYSLKKTEVMIRPISGKQC